MQLQVKKLNTEAKLPTNGHPGDAGMDFYAVEDTVFLPHEQKKIGSGMAIEIPPGFVGLIWDKSSVSFNQGLKSVGGVIDAGYRGEIIFSMYNMTDKQQEIKKGNKIAQLIIQKFESCDIVEVNDLTDTVRGEGREGSTGK